MKKHSLMLAVMLWACFSSLFAQNMTASDIDELMATAVRHQREKNYHQALQTFLTVGQLTQGQRTEKERKIHLSSQIGTAECYLALHQDGNANKLSGKILEEDLTDEERRQSELIHVVSDTLINTASPIEIMVERLELLENIKPSATNPVASAWMGLTSKFNYLLGNRLKNNLRYQESLPYLEKACDLFHALGDTDSENICWEEIGSTRDILSDFSGALDAYSHSMDLSLLTHQDESVLENLNSQKIIYERFGDMEAIYAIDRMLLG